MANIEENSGIIYEQSDRFTVTYRDTDGNELEKHFSTHAEAMAFCRENKLGC
ncbi:hypothetical protein [Bernardetia sp. MNP-M8]|uniref:hypothetical protein n=1 Tax=Bernardetia sp. MNP-M8 TaxID=3127470 RepID=UPI0030CCF234